MLKDSLTQLYRKVIFLQALSVMLVVAAAIIFDSGHAGLSAFVGGLAALMGNLVYVLVARPSTLDAVAGRRVLGRHVFAEVTKVIIVIVLMLGAFESGWFVAVWLLAAMGAVLLGQWLAFLIIR